MIMACLGLFSAESSHFFRVNHSPHIAHIHSPLLTLSRFPQIIILMVNYNMGQYYAWSNLSKFLKTAYRERFHTPRYTFTHIQPKVHTQFKFIPFQNWKANRIRDESEFKYMLMGIALVTFLFSKYVYQVREDEDMGYPILSQSVVWICTDLEEWTNPFFDIVPKNRYETTQIFPRLYELIFQTKKAKEEDDRKALELRRAIQAYDAGHK